MSSGSEDEGSRTPSDYDPEGEPDLSPKRPPVPIASKPPPPTSTRAKKPTIPRTTVAGSSSRAVVPPSPSGSVNGAAAAAAQAQAQAFHQAGYMMPAMGPGGIPIMVPGQPGAMGNERAHLYTLLRQLPMGAPGAGPGGLPFPFPM
jgi:hypothetical protein